MANTESLWVATTEETSYPVLSGSVYADVAVIGGGIAGVCCAAQLQQQGLNVVVLEANRIAYGVTGYTTAKCTSGHSLIYDELVKTRGEDAARVYAEANQWGVEWIATQGFECDLQRKPMLVFAENEEELEQLRSEFETAKSLGLPVTWSDSVDLPLRVFGAIRYENQVQFHPRKFVVGLARNLKVYERTRMMQITEDDDIYTVTTDAGEVKCRYIVCASNYPVYDPSALFTRLAPYRDYALAVRLNGPVPQNMSIGVSQQSKAFRAQPHPNGELLIVSGEGHKAGQADTAKCFARLEAYTRANFDVAEIAYRWSTQDCETPDKMPYIGHITPKSDKGFVVTGFNSWGMATAAYAGRIISDVITGRENPWAETFNPNRIGGWSGFVETVKENLNVAKHLIGDKILHRSEDLGPEDLAPGEGAVVKIDGEKVATYRDSAGVLHALSPTCTHMGCDVSWNSAEESWDCPCHGSRFNIFGQVINGPAVKNLERKDAVDQDRRRAS